MDPSTATDRIMEPEKGSQFLLSQGGDSIVFVAGIWALNPTGLLPSFTPRLLLKKYLLHLYLPVDTQK